jgi:hypothetical protein
MQHALTWKDIPVVILWPTHAAEIEMTNKEVLHRYNAVNAKAKQTEGSQNTSAINTEASATHWPGKARRQTYGVGVSPA